MSERITFSHIQANDALSSYVPEVDENYEFPEFTPEFAKFLDNGLNIWLHGGTGAGKSSLMYQTVAQAQKEGKIVAFLDLENSFNNERAEKFGVNCSELIIGHYTVAENALDTIVKLAQEAIVDVIILDSIHSMAPKGEVEDKTE